MSSGPGWLCLVSSAGHDGFSDSRSCCEASLVSGCRNFGEASLVQQGRLAREGGSGWAASPSSVARHFGSTSVGVCSGAGQPCRFRAQNNMSFFDKSKLKQ